VASLCGKPNATSTGAMDADQASKKDGNGRTRMNTGVIRMTKLVDMVFPQKALQAMFS